MKVAPLALLAALVVGAPAAPAAAPPVGYTIVGTAGANSWYVSNVTVRWTVTPENLVGVTGCSPAHLITAEGTSTSSCTAQYTWGTVTSADVVVRIDKTPPTGVGGSLSRAPDANGWFNRPVSASFGGQDAVSGIAGCTQPTYAGVDSASASLSGTCTDVAGNTSGAASVSFRYDATPPAVTPAPDRGPDRGEWYRQPVTVAFAGTDVTSGIAACSAPARYTGPDRAEAAVVGSCRDAAGNVAERGFTFRYDATAPKLTRVQAEIVNGKALVTWRRAPDVARVEIFRTPGVNGGRTTNVYKGKGTRFTDTTVKQGIRYRYEVRALDAAGNVTRTVIRALPRKPLYLPAWGTTMTRAPVILRWRPVIGARFYNVQLYRNGVKVLSTWPRSAPLRLGASWSYLGKRQRLEPGRYRWYVWAARGTRAQPDYGRPLGTSVFVVERS